MTPNENYDIQIISITGQVLDKITTMEDVNIDLSKYPSGIYLLQATHKDNGISFIRKIIKK